MNEPTLVCDREGRRQAVRARQHNGLDYLEVSEDQLELTVFFLGKAPEGLAVENVRITGGRRVRDVRVLDLVIQRQPDPDLDDTMTITVDKPGDFSAYTLCLVDLDEGGRATDEPFPGFDPRYACLDFSFKEGCPSDLDCAPRDVCPPPERDEPEIDYLAKDYASFRQLILDRLTLIMPDWQERHVPDLGITLVELLAYAGDHLSYYQDAVATEAYLDTARQRISVRRHARLMDYPMHEGNNARAWVFVETGGDVPLPPDDLAFITGYNDVLPVSGRVLTWDNLRDVASSWYEVFEPLVEDLDEPIRLHEAHNEIPFYTWGDTECCLPRGTTSATLKDEWLPPAPTRQEPPPGYGQTGQQPWDQEKGAPPATETPAPERQLQLAVGDVLIFEEVLGPKTHNPADADPGHRHVVRLTRVEPDVDPLTGQPVLEIEWAGEDALPFPVCISSIGPAPECELDEKVSVARGNVLLVDHGRRIHPAEDLGCVPVKWTSAECGDDCHPPQVLVEPGQYRPRLEESPLTFWQPPRHDAPAAEMLWQDPRRAVPWIRLTGTEDPEQPCEGEPKPPEKEAGAQDDPTQAAANDVPKSATVWTPQPDLLGSSAQDHHFVVEMDDEARAHLRFGDGELGRRPEGGTRFSSVYRVGNGSRGNVGAEAISHVVSRNLLSGVSLRPRNPLPARGGRDPEPVDEVRLFAPHAHRWELQRAITADDYAHIVMRDFKAQVQRAAAALRWTGSWYEVLVAVDPRGTAEADAGLLSAIRNRLYRYRRIGHDLAARPARYVPLDIEMTVCVLPDYLRGHVKAALLDLFSDHTLLDGRSGFFHPDNLTFGEGIYLSKLVAAAQAVSGVESVVVTRLERLFEGPNREIENGILPLGPLEVARLDNDPSFPENGRLKLDMRGGR